ncbi:hypothetical protein SCALM49S_03338 [Streptomyces californicus]
MTTLSQSVAAVAPVRSTTKPMQRTRPGRRCADGAHRVFPLRAGQLAHGEVEGDDSGPGPPDAYQEVGAGVGPQPEPDLGQTPEPGDIQQLLAGDGERDPGDAESRLTSTARPVTGCAGRNPSASRSPRSVRTSGRDQPRWYE